VDRVSEFLRATSSTGKKVALVIDDAHRLTDPWLQALSDLSGLEESGTRLVHLVLLGEPALETTLARESSRELAAKITFRDTLEPLTREETARYIEHRLKAAQCGQELFTPGAIDEVYAYSGGVPRLVNKACDAALSRNFYINETVVKAETIRNFLKLMPEERGAAARAATESRADRAEAAAGIAEEVKPLPAAARRETWRQATYAALGCCVAAVVGFTIYVMASSPQAPPAKPETPKATAPAPEGREAAKTVPASGDAVKTTTTARPKPAGAPASVRAPETEGTQGARPARRQAAAPAPAQRGEAAREAPPRRSAGEPEPDKVIDWLIKKRAEKQ
jgi:general secretion pathway protein A